MQHVNFPTHNRNHILDLVITSSGSSLAPTLSVTHCSPSDHFQIFTKLSVDRTPLPPPTFHSFRRYHSIDIDSCSCLADLQCSRLITNPPKLLGSLLIAYNTTLQSSLLDKHAPVITRFFSRSLNLTLGLLLLSVPLNLPFVDHAENIWKRTHSALGFITLPTSISASALANSLASFLADKISKLHLSLAIYPLFSLLNSDKQSDSDPIPT